MNLSKAQVFTAGLSKKNFEELFKSALYINVHEFEYVSGLLERLTEQGDSQLCGKESDH